MKAQQPDAQYGSGGAPPGLIRPPDGVPLSVYLAGEIELHIAKEDLKPGDRLPSERQLTARYGVSRTVARDAVASLEQRGVVISRPGSGTFVRDGSRGAVSDVFASMLLQNNTSLAELLHARRLIEGDNAKRAARHATGQDIVDMSSAIERMRESRTPMALAEADAEFHTALSSAGRNRLLTTMLGALRQSLIDGMVIGTRVPGARDAAIREHAAILEAVQSGNEIAAQERMAKHLADTGREWAEAGLLVDDF